MRKLYLLLRCCLSRKREGNDGFYCKCKQRSVNELIYHSKVDKEEVYLDEKNDD